MVCDRISISFKVCAVFCATGIAIAAAEISSEPPANPLAAAKRDYEAFKTSGAQSGPQGAMNLRRSLPPLDTNADAQSMPSPIQRARRIESVRAQRSAAQSKNWLIEGVMNNVGSPSANGLMTVDESADEEAAPDGILSDDSIATNVNEGRNRRAQQIGSAQKTPADRSIPASNPLDTYMSKWMTPGDLELLGTNPGRFDPTAGPLRLASRETLTSVPLSAVPITGDIGFTVHGFQMGPKNDNPYIAELSKPVAPAPLFSATRLPERVSPSLMPEVAVISPTADPVATPPAKPSLAEALKSEDDAKFFRQLNRF